jgi:NodT family efflux transporter outer membrane factor (OMF) lipoprotein
MNRRAVLAAALACALGGCTLGPDWMRPAAPEIAGYDPAVPASFGGEAGEPTQVLRTADALPAEWWGLFRSPALDAAVRRSIAGNRSLASAEASLAQAQFELAAARGGLYPTASVSVEASRIKSGTSGRLGGFSSSGLSNSLVSTRSSGGRIYNLYSIGPQVSYALDVFGATRRTVEQRAAQAEASAHQARAAYLTLTGNTVNEALTIASVQGQLAAVRDIVAANERTVDLVRQQVAAGKASQADLLTAETDLANARTAIPPLAQQLSAARHALATLFGEAPAAASGFDLKLADLTLPADVPLTLPSSLARQRPDILQAEANLHAASAAIGVATADLYPSITLSASLSDDTTTLSRLFEASTLGWSLAASLSQTLFDGGTREANRQAAIAAYQASLETYRQTLLEAFQQVADALSALEHDGELVAAERRALDAATRSAELRRFSYREGKSSLLDLLTAERSLQQAAQGYARAVGQRHVSTAQLFVALGGGWWDPPTAEPAS